MSKIRLKYLVLGLLMGCLFPLLATIIELIEFDHGFTWENAFNLHLNSSLMKIVDLAPVILGLAGYFIGAKQEVLLSQSNNLKLEYNNQDIKLENIHKSLDQKNKDLDDISYGTSHDLKSTLRGISSLVSLLEEELSVEERLGYQQLLNGRIQRMDSLLDGLMKYVRISQKKGVKNKINVYDQIEKIKNSYDVKNLNIELTKDIPDIYFDEEKFSIIIRELIDNSIKFNQSESVDIVIDGVNYNQFISLLFCDNGPGIEEDYREKVFNVFSTLENRDVFENVGMGLAIVKRALEEEEGIIRILDTKSKGVCFELQIPNKKTIEL